MRRKNVGVVANDTSLGDGLCYFVSDKEYLAHISKYGDQKEVRVSSDTVSDIF